MQRPNGANERRSTSRRSIHHRYVRPNRTCVCSSRDNSALRQPSDSNGGTDNLERFRAKACQTLEWQAWSRFAQGTSTEKMEHCRRARNNAGQGCRSIKSMEMMDRSVAPADAKTIGL